MKIKILVSCSGRRFSYAEGETVELDNALGADLVKCGFAEEVKTAGTTAKKTTTKANGDTKAPAKVSAVKSDAKEVKGNADD
ncbi:MAG: hypothetical protein LIO59_05660 [Oscillospiraceae bacterium]|nr:hypothetical protein [Oscillospiraceae bacterium]